MRPLRPRPASVIAGLVALVLGVGGTAIHETESASAAPLAAPSASSSAGATSASALADGDPARRELGAEWSAAQGDTSPWVQLSYTSTTRLASVQVFGSTAPAFDPRQSTAAALHGTLRFSDGSSVVVSGIAPGAGMPTTVAFAPRDVRWVRLDLARQIPDAPLALREITAYPVGTTPPRWQPAAGTPSYSATPQAVRCDDDPASVSKVLEGRLSLACPTPGSSVDDTAVVVLNAPAGAMATAWASWPSATTLTPTLRRVATGTAGSDGRMVLRAAVGHLPEGPFALKVTADDAGKPLDPLYVQLFHRTRTSDATTTGSHAPTGMTLQYADEFDEPLSVTDTGWGADYAASKPEPWGGSQFGYGVFADPAWGAGTMATLPGGYLRVRARPLGGYADRTTWGQQHLSGLLSSQRFGGSGFSAQQGYFEVRMLGAPGPGTWPAFWMLNSEAGTGRSDLRSGELDAVELYGHDTGNSCHTTVSWGAPEGQDGEIACPDMARSADWAAEWHTYGVRVMPGGAVFSIDGVTVAHSNQLAKTDQPFFFMIDLALGGGWPVDLAATAQTSDLYVDWVRVYT